MIKNNALAVLAAMFTSIMLMMRFMTGNPGTLSDNDRTLVQFDQAPIPRGDDSPGAVDAAPARPLLYSPAAGAAPPVSPAQAGGVDVPEQETPYLHKENAGLTKLNQELKAQLARVQQEQGTGLAAAGGGETAGESDDPAAGEKAKAAAIQQCNAITLHVEGVAFIETATMETTLDGVGTPFCQCERDCKTEIPIDRVVCRIPNIPTSCLTLPDQG